MKMSVVSASMLLACVLALSGCGGGSGGSASDAPGTPAEKGVVIGPYLYRDLEKTLPEVAGEQADSVDEGVIREFVVTRTFLLLPPAAFTRPNPSAWGTDEGVALDSDVYLWPGVNDGHVLHIRGRAGIRGTYPFTGADAVGGWDDSSGGFTWPALYGGRHPSAVGIVHDIALAYTDSAGGADLEYAAYGWWAMAPVPGGGALDTTRTLSAHGGMSLGIETFARDMPGTVDSPVTATWTGRATGHAQDADGRWVLEGDVVLNAELRGPSGRIGGMIQNMRIAPIAPDTLQVDAGRAGNWHTLQLGETRVQGNAYRGNSITVVGPREAGPDFAVPAGAYEGAFYGPEALETAGQWRLVEAYADPTMGEMVAVGAFGARRQAP